MSAQHLWARVIDLVLGAGALVGIAAVLLWAVGPWVGVGALAVTSGSMEPEISVGDLAVVRSVAAVDVRSGDVVTVERPGGRVTHRVVSVESPDGGAAGGVRALVLKGDANAVQDATPDVVEVVQRTELVVPVVGGWIRWLSRPPGVFLLATFVSLAAYVALERPERATTDADG